MPTPFLLVLRIEVPTWRAAQAVPAFVEILKRHHADASFLFSLGSDSSGRSLGHAYRPQRHGRPLGSSFADHFGWGSLLYGTLLPAPYIGRRSKTILQQLQESGHEVGILGWDSLAWVSRIEQASAAWSQDQLERANAAFHEVLGVQPQLHAAPGWRSNPHALRQTQQMGYNYASDMRGHCPFVPVWHGEIVRCLQIPTTLPTLDELLATADPANLGEQLLALTAAADQHHVFSLRLDPAHNVAPALIENLLTGWREQGYELASVRSLANRQHIDKLPRHEVIVGAVPGRSGTLLLQGDEFLSAWRQPA